MLIKCSQYKVKEIRLHNGTKPKKGITRTILINNIIEKERISIFKIP